MMCNVHINNMNRHLRTISDLWMMKWINAMGMLEVWILHIRKWPQIMTIYDKLMYLFTFQHHQQRCAKHETWTWSFPLSLVEDDDVVVIVSLFHLSYCMLRLSWPLLLIISPSGILHNVVTHSSKLTTVCILYLPSSHLLIPHCQVNLTNTNQQDFSAVPSTSATSTQNIDNVQITRNLLISHKLSSFIARKYVEW